ncbi:metal ABC transporter ATP-binding protein [Amycolatopsis aidingensis]|uniref:metal ABC transporter ATP-binding protein n=1 Tax=Amycolatopsis aidingensis TaxID=2842453 RepID=UPI001C0B96BB|nr:ABC transporter ATP-binding protein [Amycolatopsis aidingensis]
MTAGSRVTLKGVCCAHGGRQVVREVDLDVEPGQRVAMTGTNGSGKTTLLRSILGLHPAGAGLIEVDGHRARTAADWDRRRRVAAWIPQRQVAGRFPLLAGELLASSGARNEALAAAERLGVGALAAQPVHTLSGGQLQRMYLARAMGCVAAGATLLLADEPTAALDFAGQEDTAELLTSLPVTVLVVTHDRALARHCDRVLEMADGRLRELPAEVPH